MGLFSFSQKKSSGIFIPDGDGYKELTDSIEDNSINGISIHLGYNPDQIRIVFGDFDLNYDVQTVVIEIFSCNIVFVFTKGSSVVKLNKKKVDYFLRNFKFSEEFDSLNTAEILQTGIDNKSLNIEFLSRVLSLNDTKPTGIFYAKSLDLYLSFKDGFLTGFQTGDGLNMWAKKWEQLNPEIISNLERLARKFWGANQNKILNEINVQSEALAGIPDGFKNEFLQLHQTDYGTYNFLMLLVCHYERKISLLEFLDINHGRYQDLTESNSIKKFGLDRFTYEFSLDGSLICYNLK